LCWRTAGRLPAISFFAAVALVGAVVIIAGCCRCSPQTSGNVLAHRKALSLQPERPEFTIANARNGAMGKGLLPWDAHLTEFEVSPDAAVIGKTLQELAFRERHGVNVVRIERGRNTIVAPKGMEQMFPFDKITVVGTDEQLRLLKPVLEPPQSQLPAMHPE
jgi:hypothetical protein